MSAHLNHNVELNIWIKYKNVILTFIKTFRFARYNLRIFLLGVKYKSPRIFKFKFKMLKYIIIITFNISILKIIIILDGKIYLNL